MKIDIRTDEAKAKDILKEQKIRKLLEKTAGSRGVREVREDRPLGWNSNDGDGSVRETNVHTRYNYDGSLWRPDPLYEIGQQYRVDISVDGILPRSTLIVAGVDRERRTLTMLYHLTGEASRTIPMTMEGADSNLSFMGSDNTFVTGRSSEGNSSEMTTPDWVSIIGVCLVTGFVVTALAEGIKAWLF